MTLAVIITVSFSVIRIDIFFLGRQSQLRRWTLYGNEEQLPAHKKAILQACRTGDLSQATIPSQDPETWTEDLDGTPQHSSWL